MTVDWRVQELLGELEGLRRKRRDLHDGDGGGTSGGMEERVARIEKQVDQITGELKDIRKDVAEVRIDTATLKENVRHLPTKPWLFTTMLGLLTALAALTAVIVRFVPHAP